MCVLLGLRAREVDLVEDRNDRQVVLECQVQVRQSLGFDPLGGVDKENRTLAGCQGAGHLVGEVHVPGSIDHVERVRGVLVRPRHAHRLTLDCDATLTFNVHAIQVLVAHLASLDDTGELKHTVRKRRLPMIDMGDDTKVTNLRLRGAGRANLFLLRGRGDGHVYLREVVNLLIVPLARPFVLVMRPGGRAQSPRLTLVFPYWKSFSVRPDSAIIAIASLMSTSAQSSG